MTGIKPLFLHDLLLPDRVEFVLLPLEMVAVLLVFLNSAQGGEESPRT